MAIQAFPSGPSPGSPGGLPPPGSIPDKQLLLVPIISLGPDGGSAMIHIKTDLGHKHVLEAIGDTQYNVIGKYKFHSHPWSIKPSFQILPAQGEAFALEIDYKGKESTTQFHTASCQTNCRRTHPNNICTRTRCMPFNSTLMSAFHCFSPRVECVGWGAVWCVTLRCVGVELMRISARVFCFLFGEFESWSSCWCSIVYCSSLFEFFELGCSVQ